LQEGIRSGAFPGAVALVARKDEILLHVALGYAELAPHRRPMQLNTVFDIASVTKPLFALAVMKAVERGLLSLDEPLSTFLPELRRAGWERITARHLLTHTSGIPG